MGAPEPPRYAEEAALLAVMEGDLDDARRRIADFYPNELSDFAEHVSKLSDMIRAEQRRRRVAT